jgi:hypothetical protein
MDLSAEHLRALRRAVRERLASPEAGRNAGHGLVREVPGWVGRFVVMPADAGETWLWCEPRAEGGEAFPSQIVLDVPPGRYLVEVFDEPDGTHVSSESATAAPLVAGLTHTGHAVFVRVRRVGER